MWRPSGTEGHSVRFREEKNHFYRIRPSHDLVVKPTETSPISFFVVCMYVCMHICMYVCMYIYIYTHTYVFMCICVCVCVCMFVLYCMGIGM